MTKKECITIIIFMLILIFALIVLLTCFESRNIEQEKISEYEEVCEHEWVVSSRYSFLLNSYKTISRCAKCGKEI